MCNYGVLLSTDTLLSLNPTLNNSWRNPPKHSVYNILNAKEEATSAQFIKCESLPSANQGQALWQIN